MYGKKSLSIQDQEIIMEQIRNYPCLYNKSKMSYKERDVNRNAWSKVVKSLISNKTYEKLGDCCTSPVAKNQRVRASFSATKIHFLRRVPFFEMNIATIARRCSNCSGDIRTCLKISDEKYLLY